MPGTKWKSSKSKRWTKMEKERDGKKKNTTWDKLLWFAEWINHDRKCAQQRWRMESGWEGKKSLLWNVRS